MINPIFTRGEKAAGMVSANLRLGGDVQSPQLFGQLQVTGVDIDGNFMPFDMQPSQLAVNFNGMRSTLAGTVRTQQGEIYLNGDADWSQIENWRARVTAKGYFDAEDSEEARYEKRKALNAQRTLDAQSGSYARAGGVADPLPEDAPFFVKDYYDYYKTPRGYHARSLNSNDGWNVTSSLSCLNMPICFMNFAKKKATHKKNLPKGYSYRIKQLANGKREQAYPIHRC